jgi:hypothetical protein
MKKIYILLFAANLFHASLCRADVEKVYHPYVEGHKSSLEFQSLYKLDENPVFDDAQRYRLALGHSLSDRVALEGYLIANKAPADNLRVDGFELEGKWQLTEQGEYSSDWGLLFELERNTHTSEWATSMALLWEKQWPRWIVAANLFFGYETGSLDDEIETQLRSQLKYRMSRQFEPAVEFYLDEYTRGIGPVLLGSQRFGVHKLEWEFGVIFGTNHETPDQNVRFLLEYEF